MSVSFDIPILLITFKRSEKLKKVVEAINLISPTRVYVFSDFHEDPQIQQQVIETRRVIELDLNCKNIIQNYSCINLGCKYGPETAISWFFENEEYGVILEEDCLPSVDFFKFCEVLLLKYRYEEKVMQINGTNLISYRTWDYPASYYFSNITCAWGWATWKRAWKAYPKNKELYLNWFNNKKNTEIEIYRKKEIAKFRRNEVEHVIYYDLDAWDFTWRYFLNLEGGIAITPVRNLIKNIGFDLDATHTFVNTHKDIREIENLQFPLKHPVGDFKVDFELEYYHEIYPVLFRSRLLIFLSKVKYFFLKNLGLNN